jgi:lipoprotein NlpD
MGYFRLAQLLLPAFVAVLSACASQRVIPVDKRVADSQKTVVDAGKPPVSEQSLPQRQPESPNRSVVHGDTLYSIAWEAGRDYRDLAKWNRISPPYTIKPGQELRVVPPLAGKAPVASSPAKPTARNKVTNKTEKKTTAAPSKAGKPVASPAPKPVAVSADKSKTKTDAQTKNKADSAKAQDSVKPGSGSWAWPADGQILKRYGESDSGKGLDIGGTRGQSVRATAGGRVVYQGSGLRGYGQLIIIKHSDEFLSAYAHNDKIHVKEGDVVKRGQKIADMGSTGADRVKLHFEIRRQGVPTDPLKYLPKR